MAATGNVEVTIGGDVSGQIAIGNNNLQIQNHGGIVNVVKPPSRSPFRKRPGPIQQKPRPVPQLLDRTEESRTIQSSIPNSVSVSIFGEGGIGKTTFLSHIAYLPETSQYPDGVVYIYVPQQGLDDLLQLLFDTFYSTSGNSMPTAGQLRHHLQRIRSVILLDDLTLAREDVQALLGIMPLSCFVIASVQRSLWGDGTVILLEGLPEEEQVELFSREIGRPLSAAEKTDALIICYHLRGHPLKIIQAAALVTSSEKTISEVKRQVQGSKGSLDIAEGLIVRLNESQRKVLALLAAAGGALIPLSILQALLKLPGAQGVIKSLVSMGLIWSEGSQYGLVRSVAGPIEGIWDLSPWEDVLVDYFSNWSTQPPADRLIEEASEVLIKTIQRTGGKNRWLEVIRLGRMLERVLILNRRWQTWQEVLNLILNAAKASGDRSTEAWALHQLGTRAMCLNYADQARQFLTRALEIRQAIGDKGGMAATQHNLSVLPKAVVVQQPKVTQPIKVAQVDGGFGQYLLYGFGGIAGLGMLAFIAWLLWNNPVFFPSPTQSPVPTAIPSFAVMPSSTPIILTATITLTPTETSTLTSTLTFTSTYTLTPSLTPSRTVTVTPSSTPTQGVCPLQTFRFHSLASVSYIPPKVGSGDADFSGHGPIVNLYVDLKPVDSRNLRLEIYMSADEGQPDYTRAEGTKFVDGFISLPSGYIYYEDYALMSSGGNYVDTNHSPDTVYPDSSEGPVAYFIVVGDTPGNEAGTETMVTVNFNTVQVRAFQAGNCIAPTPKPTLTSAPIP